MTSKLDYKGLNSSTDPFDDYWNDTHPNGTASWEEDDEIPDFDKDEVEE